MHPWEHQREPGADTEQQAERSDEPFALLRAALERRDTTEPRVSTEGEDVRAGEREIEQL
jgi:hypothetical protein